MTTAQRIEPPPFPPPQAGGGLGWGSALRRARRPAEKIACTIGVLPVLFAAGAAAFWRARVRRVAPNRLLSGRPDRAVRCGRSAAEQRDSVLGLALLATALVPPSRALHRPRPCSRRSCCSCVLAAAGRGGGPRWPRRRRALARVSLGAGFWVLLAPPRWRSSMRCSAPAPGTASASRSPPSSIAGFAVMAHAGLFDALSLAREYRTREPVVRRRAAPPRRTRRRGGRRRRC